MSHREADEELWLPDATQLAMAPERASLAALDVLLLVTVRVLYAEYERLNEATSRDPDLVLAGSIVLLAEALHALIGRYRAHTAHALGDDKVPESIF
jgi:hypothetical protein